MRLETVGEVFATRTLDVADDEGGYSRPVSVLFGTPRRSPDGGDFFCAYQIVGLGDEAVRYAEGVDEAQAFYIAMEAVGSWLSQSPEALSGRLRWYGEPTHGFPVRQQRAQLRLLASS